MSTPASPLVTQMRSKFPGAYDDLSDQDLESKVLAKYPQYKDMASSKDTYTEAGAAANPPVEKPQSVAHVQNQMAEEGTRAQNYSDPDVQMHRAANSFTPVSNAVAGMEPIAAARGIVGGKIGSYAGGKIGPHVGLTPEQGEAAGGLIGSAGLMAAPPAAEHAPAVVDQARNLSVVAPKDISLPGGFKISRNVPTNPYEEMGNSAQYGEMAKEAGKAPEAAPVLPTPEEQLASAVRERKANYLPTKIKPSTVSTPEEQLAQAVKEKKANYIPTKVEPASVDVSKSPYYQDYKAAQAVNQEEANNKVINSGKNWTAKLSDRMPQPPAEAGANVGGGGMSGNEGRAATWDNKRVMELAKQGNREAIQQATRRGLKLPENARYVMGDQDMSRTVYNPRESTQLEGEGGIRNMSKSAPTSKARIVSSVGPGGPSTPREVVNFGGPKITTDSLGVRWAENPEGVRISIPKDIPDANVREYAEEKLVDQAQMQKRITGRGR